MIKFNFEKMPVMNEIVAYKEEIISYLKDLLDKKYDFTDWVTLPVDYDKEEFLRIQDVANEIKKEADILVVIGIGGSYLGARAAITYLSDYYKRKEGVEIIFAGNGLSEKYLKQTLDYVKDKNYYINVISKSGTTLEPSVAFEKFRELLIDKYGEKEATKRIIATTDKCKGVLKEEATKNGYRTFIVPDAIGGRYSVLTPVGLLPIAAAGFDIDKLMAGAKEGYKRWAVCDFEKNEAMKYAICRNIYYNKGKEIEVFATFSPNMQYFMEWLKQLFGESECKDNKGIFPASLLMTADLHSMGQLMQQGRRNMFETFITIEDDFEKNERIRYNDKYFVNDLNNIAALATEKAHFTGDVPIFDIKVNEETEETLGELFYFFMMSCALSSLMLKVNPFNQPGVEEYKKNIKELGNF